MNGNEINSLLAVRGLLYSIPPTHCKTNESVIAKSKALSNIDRVLIEEGVTSENIVLHNGSKIPILGELLEHLRGCTICIEDGIERCDLIDKIMSGEVLDENY